MAKEKDLIVREDSFKERRKIVKEDRISGLLDDLLSDILWFLPVKDAIATSVLSWRWRNVIRLIRKLDFVEEEDSANSIEAFRKFKRYIDNVLQRCESEAQQITSFRLKLFCDTKTEPDHPFYYSRYTRSYYISEELEPIKLNTWMCFPITHGVKQLDIRCHLMDTGNSYYKLPSAIFDCPTLEVLKLDVNLKLEVPLSIGLPVLKELHLSLAVFPEDDSLARLVSGCGSSLEHLYLTGGEWSPESSINISAPYLRSLAINIPGRFDERRTEFVLNVPNLEKLEYVDNEASFYSIGDLNALIEARLDFRLALGYPRRGSSRLYVFMSSLSNVQSLYLKDDCIEALKCESVKLPMFRNLNHLELGCVGYYSLIWHTTLMELLNSAPLLETLSFPGPFTWDSEGDDIELSNKECQLWENTQTIPSCLNLYLKRIMMKSYRNTKWELEIVKYLLRSSLVLEELLVVCETSVAAADKILIESTLKKLPRCSLNCSIKFS